MTPPSKDAAEEKERETGEHILVEKGVCWGWGWFRLQKGKRQGGMDRSLVAKIRSNKREKRYRS